MKKSKFLILAIGISSVLLTSAKTPYKSSKLKFQHFKNIKVPEPSDIAIDHDTDLMYIVSDNGLLFECSADGTIIRTYDSTY